MLLTLPSFAVSCALSLAAIPQPLELPKPSSTATTAAPQALTPPDGTATPRSAEPQSAPDDQDNFYQYSDFIDTRLTFAFSNSNFFAGPGERLYDTSSYRIGVDRDFNLFLENVDTRFTGYETLSHLVLFKKLPAFWETYETEVALAGLVVANYEGPAAADSLTPGSKRAGELSLSDSGSYLRLIKKFGTGAEEKEGSIDLTAFPVTADRFRLGYTYIISWGGSAIFPSQIGSKDITEGAVPGIRLRYRSAGGRDYAFLGFKSVRITNKQPGAMAGERVPVYGILAGAGTELGDILALEMNGGFFKKGPLERFGLEGSKINAYGVSGRATIFQGRRPKQSVDYQLYRNDPTAPDYYYAFRSYAPGTSFSLGLEGNVLAQNLEDPDRFGSEKTVTAVAAGLVGIAKLEEWTFRLDAFYKSVDFIVFNVPGFVPFQAISSNAKTTPEFFAALTAEYFFAKINWRPSLAVGVKVPATEKGALPRDLGSVGGAMPGEVRTQIIVDDTTRVVLPAPRFAGDPNADAKPTMGVVLKTPFAISKSTIVSLDFRYELNSNQPRLKKDLEQGQGTTFFDSPHRLSAALLFQARW